MHALEICGFVYITQMKINNTSNHSKKAIVFLSASVNPLHSYMEHFYPCQLMLSILELLKYFSTYVGLSPFFSLGFCNFPLLHFLKGSLSCLGPLKCHLISSPWVSIMLPILRESPETSLHSHLPAHTTSTRGRVRTWADLTPKPGLFLL